MDTLALQVTAPAIPSLPVELWAEITRHCVRSACLSLSHASRMHRALAAPVVFESLNFTIPLAKTEHGEPYSAIKTKRLQEYTRLADDLGDVCEGGSNTNTTGAMIIPALRRLSIRLLIRDPVAMAALTARFADVIFRASSLVAFRWDSAVAPFPHVLGQALVAGAPQLRCMGVRAPISEHDLELSGLRNLQQVAVILTKGIDGIQLANLRQMLQCPGIMEVQVPALVFDSALGRNREANILDPGLRHIRIHLTAATDNIMNLHRHALEHIRSLHLEGLGTAFQAFWSREPVMPHLRFLTLHFTTRTPLDSESELMVTLVTALSALTRPIERFKISDPSGDLKLGFFVFNNFRRFANLRVFAIVAKKIPYKYVKDLAAALPLTVSTVSIRIGCMTEEPDVFFDLFHPVRAQLKSLHIHCLTREARAENHLFRTRAQQETTARDVAEKVLDRFPALDAVGTNGFFFDVPRNDNGEREGDSLQLMHMRWKESTFSTTDAEWAFDSGSDAD